MGQIKKTKQNAENKDELFKSLEGIEKTVEYMASIVTDISDASKVEREGQDSPAEPFALRDVIENVVNLTSEQAKEAGLAFEVSMADDFSPWYVGNQTSVQQILINFLNNSIKYTKSGGAVSLKVFEELDLLSKDKRAELYLIVSDTGIGIKPEFISRMFEPFTREHKGDSQKNSSMGLGLSIAQNLVHSMDGTITVDSTEGKGSTFTIKLLLRRYDPKQFTVEDEDSTKIEEMDFKECHVLVAEDNLVNRKILGVLLTNEGITYEEAGDGEEVVKTFLDNPPDTFDCILMDMRMPKLDGIRATEKIRSSDRKDGKTIPIIGVSANGFSDDIRKAHEAGIDEYTTKPIDKKHLLMVMAKLINK